ncbi:uncharacterized protein FA14DRAFT_146006 [Meira miltonrushii]|uniref:F-box domain-containing protein n=1 Tax=Meira miltonrushii TaxID=1280837 RepID=A0A316VE09_9BASI|nr:uncharacterized protein FA14DRAFT_146006 [Meira miltonrushii]PWN35917.1 hypothetical protein FA14DRAFT_146006 [Meira miltonrushii]
MTSQTSFSPQEKGKHVIRDNTRTSLDSLPSEILDIIGFYCAISTPKRKEWIQHMDSVGQSSVPSSSSQTEYAHEQPPAFATPPVNLRNLVVTSRRNHAILNADSNPRLYARVFKTKFDVDAISRRFGPMAISSASLAKELQRRCICLKRIRRAVAFGRIKEQETGEKGEAEILENLWIAFMMLTENDGQNIQQLRWARIEEYLKMFRTQDLLEEAIRSGYPPNTTTRALALHLDYMLSSPARLASETRDESDEKLFVLRPFVFAAHRYDAFLAPWTVRQLPIQSSSTSPISPSQAAASDNPFIADLTPKDALHRLAYCGKEISIRPPNITHAACCSFFMKVEHDPGVSGINAATDPYEGKARSEIRKLTTRDPLKLLSFDYDKDIARLVACTSPYHSPGLNAASHLGDFEGSWEGRFTFFDFDSYRDMLGGKVRSLYEGPFGEQPQVWKLKEHVVKVNYSERIGGKGSLMNAGYYDDDPEPSQVQTIRKRRASWESEARERALKGLRQDTNEIPQHIMADWHNYPSFGHDEPASSSDESMEDKQNDKYEILISGTGHSAWGRFILRGRVRSWDGMVSITKEYRPDGRGRWLYRGYVVAGNKLVGRWRDTFTPEDMSGYEGCFLLHRRGA